MNRDYYAGMTEGRIQERERIIGLLEKRRDDLLACHKNDDCHVRADAIDVVISDILEDDTGG